MRKKQVLAIGLALSLTYGYSVPVLASVRQEDVSEQSTGKFASEVLPDGVKKNCWHQGPDMKWYHFDENGKKSTGWYKDQDGLWYFLNQDGIMITGWYKDGDGKWYFLNDSGAMLSNGWNWIDGNKDGIAECYYLQADGSMMSGGVTPDGFYVNEGGAWMENGIVQSKDVAKEGQKSTVRSGGGSSGGGSSSGSSDDSNHDNGSSDSNPGNHPGNHPGGNEEVPIDQQTAAYGAESSVIVINAADALANTPYAFTSMANGVDAEENKTFIWTPVENGRGVQLLTADGDNPNPEETSEWSTPESAAQAPRLVYKVNAPESGTYYVSFFSNNPDTNSDSFYVAAGEDAASCSYRITSQEQISNGDIRESDYGATTGERWFVCNKKNIELKEGVNYIQICGHESGVLLRQIMLSRQNPIFIENGWKEASQLVTGYIDISTPKNDVALEYGGSEEITIQAEATNGNAVEFKAVSGNPDAVEITGDGDGTFTLEAVNPGNSTITVTASAKDCADVLGVFNVTVANDLVGEGDEEGPVDLMVAPATNMEDSITLVWDKPANYDDVTGYRIFQDDSEIASTQAEVTHYTAEGLDPETTYQFRVEAVRDEVATASNASTPVIVVETKKQGKVIDVTESPYNADSEGKSKSTECVQQAIDDCPEGGTVLIPEGATVLTGALDLKSNITLRVDGTLQGTDDVEDYTIKPEYRSHYNGLVNDDGLILTRYEGWEMYCYRSLLNAGYLNPENRKEVTCENITICGSGTIRGQGNGLGGKMKQLYNDKKRYPEYVSDGSGGRRLRGRLLGLIQCKNVNLTGVTVENPSCWTIHMIYCDTLTTHGINIKSSGVENGDGWDPDSSRNMMIFDTAFTTGDDCIAIKSGKNLDGNIVDMPTKNIRIFDLKLLGGHGMAIGSEQSGGVEDIYIRDCVIDNTNYGLELKAQNKRGGYIKNLTMLDCSIDKFMAHSVGYNADGEAGPDLPIFRGITIKNTTIAKDKRAVELIGFSQDGHSDQGKEHYVNDVLLENVTLGDVKSPSKEIYLDKCQGLTFKNVKLYNGNQPDYIIKDENTVLDLNIINEMTEFKETCEAEWMYSENQDKEDPDFKIEEDSKASNGNYIKLLGGKAKQFYPAVSREETALEETRGFLDRVYNGSLGLMVDAMVSSRSLSEQDIEELMEILKKAEEGSRD